ncbi:hypothetical protein SODALDRAFT_355628 [Sodiomyces alkalinus F11]|uniref:Uncharacterized protein n=1 Tax=Sodiomyces alkalinus (strain CBS 110278 / VKM F-3762 / F11) TaxID=1314773 RepID=A0A3N2Q9I0_SODAK|nr:hypothetical protein SODALDRAFT_355628 [Sodiomyces alkalinus F11]ROT43419.1 hypothetical protein SODALDRAFT_355628 [Sodiomyces alkalinus F11]
MDKASERFGSDSATRKEMYVCCLLRYRPGRQTSQRMPDKETAMVCKQWRMEVKSNHDRPKVLSVTSPAAMHNQRRVRMDRRVKKEHPSARNLFNPVPMDAGLPEGSPATAYAIHTQLIGRNGAGVDQTLLNTQWQLQSAEVRQHRDHWLIPNVVCSLLLEQKLRLQLNFLAPAVNSRTHHIDAARDKTGGPSEKAKGELKNIRIGAETTNYDKSERPMMQPRTQEGQKPHGDSVRSRQQSEKQQQEVTALIAALQLLFKVSDITTLVSVALVVIKTVAGTWSATVLWGCARYMLSKEPTSLTLERVSSMLRWKLLLGVEIRRDSLMISLLTIVIFIQAFTGPLLTGSVNWTSGSRLSVNAVSATTPGPGSLGAWYWYNAQGSFDKRPHLRTGVGLAGLAWADPSTMDAHGRSVTGNGCRHIMNDDGLLPDSVVVNVLMPCIDIHGIHWYRSADEMGAEEWDELNGGDLSLVNDDPFFYYTSGVSFVYNGSDIRSAPSNWEQPPPPYRFSGNKTVVVLLDRHEATDPPCRELTNTIFGDMDALPYYKPRARATGSSENCFLIGRVSFTAGVTTSRRARYINGRVIEDQTPIEEVEFAPDPWVREAIWLLPDMMTMIAITNASQLPSHDNIDYHTHGLLRQSYLGAWSVLSRNFNETQGEFRAFPAGPRLVAVVSFARVFSWLALCLLMTVSGALVLGFFLREKHLARLEDSELSNMVAQLLRSADVEEYPDKRAA